LHLLSKTFEKEEKNQKEKSAIPFKFPIANGIMGRKKKKKRV